jgi:very-short-patch-repair endonuclease
MSVHQIVVLRFTPKEIRTQPAQVLRDIRAALEGARGRSPLNLRTVATDPGRAR